MSLINIQKLSHTFVRKELFYDVDIQINPGDRIGLIGPNGTGKTTLLRFIAGEAVPDNGEIRISRGTHLAYLPQDVQETLTGPLLKSVLNSIPERSRIEEEIPDLAQYIEEDLPETEKAETAARLAELHDRAMDLERRFPPHHAEKILMGLGFTPEDFPRPVVRLSGGWKMRAALGSMLYQEPDLLLLDEPTNHLDIPSIHWLEAFLEGFKGAMVLICHDRDFLNRQINRVISFEPEGLRFYTGNYDDYLRSREEEKKTLQARARKQEQRVKEAQRFIDRFRAKASKARQAQSKIKLVEKIELVKTHQKKKKIRFSFPEVSQSVRDVISIQNLSKGFGTKSLYQNIHLAVTRRDRVAIIGPNGSGKTTLLKMIASELKPDRGRVILGHNVTMSYYAQHHTEMLNPAKSILEEVYQVVPHEAVSYVRAVCGSFLFTGEDVDKRIGILSGGEKARVSLAKILIQPGNLLVMDEPTNHLDLVSSEILINALAHYNGTILFVSHNQAFVNRLSTRIWDIREGDIEEYPGTLYEYYDHLRRMEDSTQGIKDMEPGPTMDRNIASREINPKDRKTIRRERAERRQEIASRLRPIQDKLAKLEDRIDALEGRKKELEALLADPDIYHDKDNGLALLKEYGETKGKVEELMARWEYHQQDLEETQKELGLYKAGEL